MQKAIHDSKIKQAKQIERIGATVTRYGLAIVLIWIGILKFTVYEADGVQPLGEHSPFLSWIVRLLGANGFASLLGVIEIALGLLICCRVFAPKLSAWGSIGAIITFCITITFLLSTPGVIQQGYEFPFISPMPGQFLIKDFVLLGAAIYTTGEALSAVAMRRAANNITTNGQQ
ncbi:MAG: DUF417 family protein [Chitinophagaceae bacterium]